MNYQPGAQATGFVKTRRLRSGLVCNKAGRQRQEPAEKRIRLSTGSC